ncbi:hypothetical protein NB069_00035 [Leclercia adecarboxylata]|uniref:hypothetical protein n=1 Tax=Leclercia adecarboxylata TaxID=83655 RepID=UPI00202A27AC|nr:hypothetical protein [Leclercia adecarboxylata]URN99321.1 hypothetical protein NB069_00035 [Leclercia adecarboxylata]
MPNWFTKTVIMISNGEQNGGAENDANPRKNKISIFIIKLLGFFSSKIQAR